MDFTEKETETEMDPTEHETKTEIVSTETETGMEPTETETKTEMDPTDKETKIKTDHTDKETKNEPCEETETLPTELVSLVSLLQSSVSSSEERLSSLAETLLYVRGLVVVA